MTAFAELDAHNQNFLTKSAAPGFFMHDAGQTGLFVPCAAGDALWP